MGVTSTTVTTEFSEITHSYGHYAVQGHLGSVISVPIEIPYMSSYVSVVTFYYPAPRNDELLVQFSLSTIGVPLFSTLVGLTLKFKIAKFGLKKLGTSLCRMM